MPHVLSARASSLGASTILIGALLAVALTATHTVWSPFAPSPPPIESVTERPPEPLPPPPPAHTSAIPQTQDFTTISFPALPTFDGPPTPSLDPTPLGAGPVEITNPSWLHRPSGLERFYPRRALERGIEGRAMLDCLVSATGAL